MGIDLDALAKRKIAGVPLPIAGGVLAAGAAYAAWKTTRVPSDPAEDVPEGDASGNAEGDSADGGQPIFLATAPGAINGTGSTVTSANTQDTDEAWKRRAIEWLVAQGNDPSTASRAMSKYLNGSQLSFDEGALRDAAIGQFGLPPESVPTGKTQVYKGPASKQGEPPLSHVVKGTSDDSFGELARLYYGMAGEQNANLIEAANAGVNGPFPVGATIRIPRYRNPKYVRATAHTRSLIDIARKNGTTPARIKELNGDREFPAKVGTRVRVA